MLSSSMPHRHSPEASWLSVLQAKVQDWIRREIIDEDPYDEEWLTAQALYEQFQLQQMEKSLAKVVTVRVGASPVLR